MRLLTLIAALISLSAANASAQAVDQLRQSFDQRCEQAATLRDDQLDKLKQSYQAALERLLDKTETAGNLDAALPIHQELEALKQGTATLPVLPDNAGELKSMRTKYLDTRQQILKTHATALVGLADKMETALKAREAELTKAGKIADAVAARETREELAKDPDVRSARDLLMLGGAGGRGRAALQLRRYGDNLEVLVFYDRLGKISMDSPVENVREKTGDGKELGNTKAKVLGEFVGAKGYTVDPFVAYQHTFDTKDPGGLVLAEILPEFNHEVEKSKGLKLSLKPGAVNPYGFFGKVLSGKAAKGTYRISSRYFIPKSNQAISGFRFVQSAGEPIGGFHFDKRGEWTVGEAIAGSSHELDTLLLYVDLVPGRTVADAKDDWVVLGDVNVEHLKFTAYVQQRFGESSRPEQEQKDPFQQPVFIANGEFAAKP